MLKPVLSRLGNSSKIHRILRFGYYNLINFNYKFEIYPNIIKDKGNYSFYAYELLNLIGDDEALQKLFDIGQADSVYWDVGAAYGGYSLALADYFDTCTIVGFEPDTRVYEQYIKNIEVNTNLSDQICPKNIGIGRESGEFEFYKTDTRGNSSYSKNNISYFKNRSISDVELIQMKTIDDLIYDLGFPAPDFIKVDVEGHMMDVIQGGNRTWREIKPIIVAEPHFHNGPFTSEELQKAIEKFGYVVKSVDP